MLQRGILSLSRNKIPEFLVLSNAFPCLWGQLDKKRQHERAGKSEKLPKQQV